MGDEINGKKLSYDLMDDLLVTMMSKMPVLKDIPKGPDKKYHVTSEYVLDIMEKTGHVYEVRFTTGEVMLAEKISEWRSWWKFTMPNGRVYNTRYTRKGNPIRDYIFEKYFTDLEQLEWRLKHHDYWACMSDDHRVWSAGQAAGLKIAALKTKLIEEGKEKEVNELVEKYTPR